MTISSSPLSFLERVAALDFFVRVDVPSPGKQIAPSVPAFTTLSFDDCASILTPSAIDSLRFAASPVKKAVPVGTINLPPLPLPRPVENHYKIQVS